MTSKEGRGGRRYAPYVFTEQGVAMLSGVLRSDRAIAVNIEIMRVFVELRRVASSYVAIEKRLEEIERELGGHDEQLSQIFMALRQLISPPGARVDSRVAPTTANRASAHGAGTTDLKDRLRAHRVLASLGLPVLPCFRMRISLTRAPPEGVFASFKQILASMRHRRPHVLSAGPTVLLAPPRGERKGEVQSTAMICTGEWSQFFCGGQMLFARNGCERHVAEAPGTNPGGEGRGEIIRAWQMPTSRTSMRIRR